MKTFLLFLVSLPQILLAQSLIVGNAGDGVLLGGTVYLRDLYEDANHKRPFAGSEIDPEIRYRLLAKTWNGRYYLTAREGTALVSLDANLFARKLTDLNRLHPNLGFMILAAAESLQWKMESDDSVFQMAKELRVVDGVPVVQRAYYPLANRTAQGVALQESSWFRMPESNRVALILHELYSALQLPVCNTEVCLIDDSAVRKLTALSFQPGPATPAFRELVGTKLAIPLMTDPVTRNMTFKTISEKARAYCQGQSIEIHRDPFSLSGRRHQVQGFEVYHGVIQSRQISQWNILIQNRSSRMGLHPGMSLVENQANCAQEMWQTIYRWTRYY